MLNASEITANHRNQLFILSCFALVASGFVFTMQNSTAKDLISTFHLTAETAGWALGAWSLAFAICVFVGSPLCDYMGMRNLLLLAGAAHIIGTLMLIFAASVGSALGVTTTLYIACFITGIGSGTVEAVINPLIPTLFPENKIHKLNVLHAWWPMGIVLGGVIAFFVQSAGVGGGNNWKIRMAIALIPAIIYFVMTLGEKFPATERVQAGVSTGEMVKQATNWLFIVWFLCMFGTAAMELAPGRWVDAMLTATVGFQGILLLSYVSLIMFLFRFFAGTISHKVSPVGLMCVSSVLAGLGLYSLSIAHSPVTGLLAATLWAIGVCFMWPTMLGVVSERFPKGGALLIGLMGTAGQLSIQIFLPIMGKWYDNAYTAAITAGKSAKDATLLAGPVAFKNMALIAVVLFIVFGGIFLYDKSKGGYKVEKIAPGA